MIRVGISNKKMLLIINTSTLDLVELESRGYLN